MFKIHSQSCAVFRGLARGHFLKRGLRNQPGRIVNGAPLAKDPPRKQLRHSGPSLIGEVAATPAPHSLANVENAEQ